MKPTVFADVTNDMTIAQEEIFGPVLSIIPYDDDDDAVRIANDSLYGLSGGVWSADSGPGEGSRPPHPHRRGRGQRRRLQPAAPFGGYKQSGNGREIGPYGLEEFLQTKSLQR